MPLEVMALSVHNPEIIWNSVLPLTSKDITEDPLQCGKMCVYR